jgi:hypothetical protein
MGGIKILAVVTDVCSAAETSTFTVTSSALEALPSRSSPYVFPVYGEAYVASGMRT